MNAKISYSCSFQFLTHDQPSSCCCSVMVTTSQWWHTKRQWTTLRNTLCWTCWSQGRVSHPRDGVCCFVVIITYLLLWCCRASLHNFSSFRMSVSLRGQLHVHYWLNGVSGEHNSKEKILIPLLLGFASWHYILQPVTLLTMITWFIRFGYKRHIVLIFYPSIIIDH